MPRPDQPRKSPEYKRADDEISIDTLCAFARDIMWRTGNPLPVDEDDAAMRSWIRSDAVCILQATDMDSGCPEYVFYYEVPDEPVTTYEFNPQSAELIVTRPELEEEFLGNETDIAFLLDQMTSNEAGVARPTIDRLGAKVFETMAIHYAITDMKQQGILPYAAILDKITDSGRRRDLRDRAIDAVMRHGVDVDGAVQPYTRSRELVSYALDNYATPKILRAKGRTKVV